MRKNTKVMRNPHAEEYQITRFPENFAHAQTDETRRSFLRPWTPGTRLTKGVVRCTLRHHTGPAIEIVYQGPYDVVISCLCILNRCKTTDDFLKAVGKLATLVKSKGHLLLSFVEPKKVIGVDNFKIGNKTYNALAVDRTFMQSALRNHFDEIAVEFFPMPNYKEMLGATFLLLVNNEFIITLLNNEFKTMNSYSIEKYNCKYYYWYKYHYSIQVK